MARWTSGWDMSLSCHTCCLPRPVAHADAGDLPSGVLYTISDPGTVADLPSGPEVGRAVEARFRQALFRTEEPVPTRVPGQWTREPYADCDAADEIQWT